MKGLPGFLNRGLATPLLAAAAAAVGAPAISDEAHMQNARRFFKETRPLPRSPYQLKRRKLNRLARRARRITRMNRK